MKAWLKGGIIGIIIFLVLFIIAIILPRGDMGNIFDWLIGYLTLPITLRVFDKFFSNLQFNMGNLFLESLIFILRLIYFFVIGSILGALTGWIIGRIKSSR